MITKTMGRVTLAGEEINRVFCYITEHETAWVVEMYVHEFLSYELTKELYPKVADLQEFILDEVSERTVGIIDYIFS